jgi:hypothetical protein
MPPPVSRQALIRAVRLAEARHRWAASQLVVPGWVRYQLIQTADALARTLDRVEAQEAKTLARQRGGPALSLKGAGGSPTLKGRADPTLPSLIKSRRTN